MKQIMILFLILLFTSCDESVSPLKDDEAKEETTLTVLENTDSSLTVSLIEEQVYLLDTTGVVRYSGAITSGNNVTVVPAGVMFTFILSSFLLGICLGGVLFT